MAHKARGNKREVDAVEQEIEQTRERLAVTIDELVDRVSPKRVAARGMSKAKQEMGQLTESMSGLFSADGISRGTTRRIDPATGVADDVRSTDYVVRRGPAATRSLLIGGAVVAVAVTAVVIWRRSRR